MPSSDTRSRLQALRRLLEKERASTQEELREELEKLDFEVTQSTISRDLKRLGAIKANDAQGRTTYRLPHESPSAPFVESLSELILNIRHNGAMIVVTTTPGAASLIARHIDYLRWDEIMGTIAGDDTIFVAPSSTKNVGALVKRLEKSFENDEG